MAIRTHITRALGALFHIATMGSAVALLLSVTLCGMAMPDQTVSHAGALQMEASNVR